MIGAHRFRERLSAGHPVFGLIVNFNSPWFVDAAGLMGFDFAMLDAEHGPLSPESAEAMMRAAEAAGISPIVRVPANLPHEILRYLDIGAVGVQVPHLETAAETRAAADAVRYPPDGHRGLAAITRAASYGMSVPTKSYMEIANREVVFLAMVETAKAVENIDAIASTPGVDAIIIGPGDLSASLGHGGDRSAPAVKQAITHVIARARAHGKWVSLPAGDAGQAKECLQLGAQIVQVPAINFMVHFGRRFLKDAAP